MKNNQPPSVGSPAVTPTYIYFVGETDIFQYERSDENLSGAQTLQPKLLSKYATMSRDELGTMLGEILNNHRRGPGPATHPTAMFEARMILLLEAYLKGSLALGPAIAIGQNSFVFTAFKTADGHYVIRLCVGVRKDRLLTSADAVGLVLNGLAIPWLRSRYESDGLSPRSAYHRIASKSA